jgi:hypothetical protein
MIIFDRLWVARTSCHQENPENQDYQQQKDIPFHHHFFLSALENRDKFHISYCKEPLWWVNKPSGSQHIGKNAYANTR